MVSQFFIHILFLIAKINNFNSNFNLSTPAYLWICVQTVELERDSLSQEVDKLNDTIQQLENEIRLRDRDKR